MEGYSQADILAALQRQSSAPPPPAKQYKELEKTDLHDSSDSKVNTRKLYCPREGCRAVIVQPGTCELIEGKADVLPREEGSPFAPTEGSYWVVRGGPMAFDNIGYSRAAPEPLHADTPGNKNGAQHKFLICAECDLGPLGWAYDAPGGKGESYLAADRLKYSHP